MFVEASFPEKYNFVTAHRNVMTKWTIPDMEERLAELQSLVESK